MTGGISLTIEIGDLRAAEALVSRLAHADMGELMTELAALGESQTRERLEAGGPAPDGAPWAPNQTGTKILMRTGRHLHDSVASMSSDASAEWGAAWEFAHVHQFGATIAAKSAKRLRFLTPGGWRSPKSVTIPARPFVGLSPDNSADLESQVTDFLGRLVSKGAMK